MTNSVGINHNVLDKNTPYFFINNINYKDVNAFIAHYVHQAYNVYYKRKVLLPRDDTNQYRSVILKDELDKHYNNIENIKKYN
jgi:hypothetical protein